MNEIIITFRELVNLMPIPYYSALVILHAILTSDNPCSESLENLSKYLVTIFLECLLLNRKLYTENKRGSIFPISDSCCSLTHTLFS